MFVVFFFNDTATTEIYTRSLVGSRQMCIRDRAEGMNWSFGELGFSPVGWDITDIESRGGDWSLYLSLIHISEPTRPY